MELLVTGGNGLLGSNVVAAARRRDWPVTATYHETDPMLSVRAVSLDLDETERIDEVIDGATPDAVVNCAAMTDVDGCEADQERAMAINATGAGELAGICADHDIDLCHVSTDYVFDGASTSPYAETDEPKPIQAYGRSKLAGERAVRDAHPHPLIVRPSFVYGVHRGSDELTGFPAWVRDALTAGKSVGLYDDQHVTPSRAEVTAHTILDLLAAGESGLLHVACRTCTTPYEFGLTLADRLDVSPELVGARPLASDDRPATRPGYTCLDVSEVERRLGRPQQTLESTLDGIEWAL